MHLYQVIFYDYRVLILRDPLPILNSLEADEPEVTHIFAQKH